MRFGNCASLAECDWGAYAWSIIPYGTPGFVVFSALAVFAVIYFLTYWDRCRPRLALFPGGRSRPPVATLSRWVLGAAAVCLGAAGLALVVLGWVDIAPTYHRAWQLYAALLAALWQAIGHAEGVADGLTRQLVAFDSALTSYAGGSATASQGLLLDLLTQSLGMTTELSGLLSELQDTADNVDNLRAVADTLISVYRWIVLPVAICVSVVLGFYVVAGVLYTRRPFLVAVTSVGFASTATCWLTLVTALILKQAVVDGCSDVQSVQLADLFDSLGLTDVTQQLNASLQELSSPAALATLLQDEGQAAVQACEAQAAQCDPTSTAGPVPCAYYALLVCPALGSVDTFAALLNSSDLFGCGPNCTVTRCAQRCTDPTLAAYAQFLTSTEDTVENATESLQALQDLLNVTGATVGGLFDQYPGLCVSGLRGMDLVSYGLSVLGTASFLGLVCLCVLELSTRPPVLEKDLPVLVWFDAEDSGKSVPSDSERLTSSPSEAMFPGSDGSPEGDCGLPLEAPCLVPDHSFACMADVV
eukprot:EG_transcript_3464